MDLIDDLFSTSCHSDWDEMHILVVGYSITLLIWLVFQVRSMLKDRFPSAVIVTEALSGALLILGLISSEFRVVPTFAITWWRLLIIFVLVSSAALRVISVRHVQYDVELSANANRGLEVFSLVTESALISPAIYLIEFSVTLRTDSSGYYLLSAVACALGVAIGCFLPRFPSVLPSNAETKLIEWLASPQEYGEPPDEIHLLDTRFRKSPGRDRKTLCSLYRYRYGDEWSIGFVGHYIFSLDAKADLPLERLYAEYEEFYVETVLKAAKRDLKLE
ncbi:MAG: hypothetical protein JWN86_3876 [Planctomycetota bacterium]|nr:hypothetical protein [Planctomycetota bacterium]